LKKDWGSMNIMEVLSIHPKAADILAKYNIGCLGCFAARAETLAQGLTAHGLDSQKIIKELDETFSA
jgi:hybrid cluster-associated redox disulfide protein